MKRRRLIRAVAESVAVGVLNFAGLHAMYRWRVMESILAPGPQGSRALLALAILFVLVRFVLFFVVPGWLLARVYLAAAEPEGAPCEPAEAEAAS